MEKIYDLDLNVRSDKKRLIPAEHLDIEKILRLHPNWFVNGLERDGERFSAELKDSATDKKFSLAGRLVSSGPEELTLEMTTGELAAVRIVTGSDDLKVLVDYRNGEPAPEDEQNVLLWLRSIVQYLRLYATSTLNTMFFRLVMNRMLLKMDPSQRKISLMLIRITIVEVAVILVIILGYVFIARK